MLSWNFPGVEVDKLVRISKALGLQKLHPFLMLNVSNAEFSNVPAPILESKSIEYV